MILSVTCVKRQSVTALRYRFWVKWKVYGGPSPHWRFYLLKQLSNAELRKEMHDAIQRYQVEVNPRQLPDDDDAELLVPPHSSKELSNTRNRRCSVWCDPSVFAIEWA